MNSRRGSPWTAWKAKTMSIDHTATRPVYATPLRSGGSLLETEEAHLGELRDSSPLLDDPAALRARMAEDGYLLLRNFHDRELVLDARREVARRLENLGYSRPGTDPMDAVGMTAEEAEALYAQNKGSADKYHVSAAFMTEELAMNNEPLDRVITDPR